MTGSRSNRLLANSCAERNKRANRSCFLVMCYNEGRMEIHRLKYIFISLPSLSEANLREWLRHTRRTAPILIALLMVIVLGQLVGQQRCSFPAGQSAPVCVVDGIHIQMTFTHTQAPSTDSPMPLMPGSSQSHELHHCHCQFAVLLTINAMIALLVLLGLMSAPQHVRLQINLTPPAPPPRFAHL